MEIVRKYKKYSTPRFLDLVEIEIKHEINREDYYEFLDELKMRKLESISEGEIFKIKKQAISVLERLEQRTTENPSWIEEHELSELRQLAGKV